MLCSHESFAQYNYRNEPVLQVIQDIKRQTSYRFLYRDALVAGIRLTFSSDEDHIWDNFGRALRTHDLNLKVDTSRRQAVIFRRENGALLSKEITISGQVVNASTGVRLPFASIFWEQNGRPNGVSSNKSGVFTIERTFKQSSINLRCSYVGYVPETVTLDLTKPSDIRELTFRLKPKKMEINKLVVVGRNNNSNLNKHAASLVNISTFSPMGESNTLRALQALPSVSLSPALSGGLNVRGSPTDGFRVMLDGVTIFNQSHLFGLIDSFNSDALQRIGFVYDIAPVQYQAPPGGTLSLLTKTGSLHKVSGTGGISNSAVRFSLGGPIKKGRSSWYIAARKSYMDAVNWFSNGRLVRWGLNVNRRQSSLADKFINFQSILVKPKNARASFSDFDAKIYFESKNGDRIILSGYYGGDHTHQKSERLFRSLSPPGSSGFSYQPVLSKNNWQNGAASIRYQHWFGENVYSTFTAGTSIYKTSFSKDDFTYLQVDPLDQSLRAFIYPFKSKSVLNDFKFEQKTDIYAGSWTFTGGIVYKYYLGQYLEHSFNRPGYFSTQSANNISVYSQVNYNGSDIINFFGGLRGHYYSNGHYLRWSPRIKLKFFPKSDVSLAAGYSRNYQFLSDISLSNTVTSNIWILAGRHQPPTSVNYYTAGAYFDIFDFLYAQVEGYIKKFDNVRLHELNTFSLSNTFNKNPWYIDNSGTGKGLEFLVHLGFKLVTFTQTLTISSIKLSNPAINNGKAFYADWDRRYRYTAKLETHPLNHFSLYLSWMLATGAPNRLATFGPQNKKRLDDYRRADLSAKYTHRFQSASITFLASIFNVFNHSNIWYRDLIIAIDRSSTPAQFRGATVDVYDIGFQPSFNISVAF